ncbi:hypothetical protein PHMEG_00027455 [Phytophthora megakarya]|uniref:Uncharacterized protein n=1 Tax=Phytophthora megakarya TaxID=4795 RepID=A0A225V7C3_9STRA|nr:hypothetical protein PHMEG_00027455 [Phytophthora megakarya]
MKHAVMIDSGTHCASVAVPVILKAFLHGHGNPVVKAVIGEFGVVMLEKMSTGGVLVHVRTAGAKRRLAGEELTSWANDLRSNAVPYLLTNTANDIFLALCELGARPLFLSPRDVNLQAQVVTPTWRYYFGSSETPFCLCVDDYRATRFRASRYGVSLPGAQDASGASLATALQHFLRHPATTVPSTRTRDSALETPQDEEPDSTAALLSTGDHFDAVDDDVDASSCTSVALDAMGPPVSGAETPMQDHEDDPMETAADADQDLLPPISAGKSDYNMEDGMETGFKRTGKSFADPNPYSALESFECDFELFEPSMGEDKYLSLLVIPRSSTTGEEVTHPKRSKKAKGTKRMDETPFQLLIRTAHEACLETSDDRVTHAADRLADAQQLHSTSKNMDLDKDYATGVVSDVLP